MKKLKIAVIALSVAAALLVGTVATLGVMLSKASRGTDDTLEAMDQYRENKRITYMMENQNLSHGQIVFVGDSITDLYKLDDHYTDLPLETYNRGVGGDTTSLVLNRLDVSVTAIAPSVVVLLIGANDVNGYVEDAKLLGNYKKILDEIRTSLPDTKLYCVSIVPQNDMLESYSSLSVTANTARILALNPQIKKLAEDSGAVYVDLFPHLADENNRLRYEYSDDGLHLNETGLRVWTEVMLPLLRKDCSEIIE